MSSDPSCSSIIGTVPVPYGVLISNGLYGVLMIVYCVFVTYLLFIQSTRKTTTLPISSRDTSQSSESAESNEETPKRSKDENTKSTVLKSKTKHGYRMEQEQVKRQSSEYTRRGILWSSHASWHLPSAPRQCPQARDLDSQGLEHILDLLKKYDVDPLRGFLPQHDPLQRLPYARYHLW